MPVAEDARAPGQWIMSRLRRALAFAAWGSCLLAAQAIAQPSGTSRPGSGVVLSAEAGDIACYLRIRDESGQSRSWMAAFELCEASEARIGRRFALEWEPTRVAHPSCQGDVNCRRTQQVMLVARLRPLAK